MGGAELSLAAVASTKRTWWLPFWWHEYPFDKSKQDQRFYHGTTSAPASSVPRATETSSLHLSNFPSHAAGISFSHIYKAWGKKPRLLVNYMSAARDFFSDTHVLITPISFRQIDGVLP